MLQGVERCALQGQLLLATNGAGFGATTQGVISLSLTKPKFHWLHCTCKASRITVQLVPSQCNSRQIAITAPLTIMSEVKPCSI